MMKKILLLLCTIGLFSSVKVNAQATFSVADTVWQSVSTTATINDFITNISANNIKISWRVTASNFPADWLTDSALSICDNYLCRANSSGQLWTGTSGMPYASPNYYYSNTAHDSVGDFHMLLDLTNVTTTGAHYLTVTITDVTVAGVGNYSTTTTFVINKIPEAVTNVNNPENNINLYPNPAHNEVNLVYNASADIKSIAVYNIIGKIMAVYKATDNSGANLNLENLPSGIYFVRLINSHGDVVVTRKFTKQ